MIKISLQNKKKLKILMKGDIMMWWFECKGTSSLFAFNLFTIYI